MTSRKISRKNLLASCAAIGPGDGLDPRLEPHDPSGKVPNRKALQLCGQVERTLSCVLAECRDEVLRDLHVASVTPAPNSSRLLVTMAATATDEVTRALEHLENARGLLRHEMAAAIHRRRVPDLMFRVLGPDSGPR